jgi:CheY-like chemotaxis protein
LGEEGYTMEKKRLLLVDDDQVARELIEEFMQYDCDCISTQNGVEGFSYLERNPGQIDLIVMDLIMSVMDGFELIRRAQEHPLNKNIPILVIASSDRQEDIRKAFMLGADDVILKPLEADIVKKRVNNMFDIADSRGIHNVMEDLVRIEIEENIESLGICPCPLCRRDLMTLALNNVPPKYVNTEKGAIMSKVGSMSSTERIKLLAEIARYAEMVRDYPRHAPVQSDIAQ